MSSSRISKNNREQVVEVASTGKKCIARDFSDRVSRSPLVASYGGSFVFSGTTPRVNSTFRNSQSTNGTVQFQQQSSPQLERFFVSCDRSKNDNFASRNNITARRNSRACTENVNNCSYAAKNIRALPTESKQRFIQVPNESLSSNNGQFLTGSTLLQSPVQRSSRIEKFVEQQQANSMGQTSQNTRCNNDRMQQQNKYNVPAVSESGLYFFKYYTYILFVIKLYFIFN